jgi:hypothetical protein
MNYKVAQENDVFHLPLILQKDRRTERTANEKQILCVLSAFAVNKTPGLLVGHLVNFTPIRGIVLIVHSHDINNRLIGAEVQIGRGR